MKVVIIILLCICSALAQGALQQQPLKMPRNPELEREAKHNLEVARYYIKKKAYKGATDRLYEIVYTYPEYSKFDEVLWLLASALQKMDSKDEAVKYYKKLIEEFPESQYAKQSKKMLEELNTHKE